MPKRDADGRHGFDSRQLDGNGSRASDKNFYVEDGASFFRFCGFAERDETTLSANGNGIAVLRVCGGRSYELAVYNLTSPQN